MVTSLRFMAFAVAGACYFKLGCEHGGWYWPLVGYPFLELIALWLELRCTKNVLAEDNDFDKSEATE